MGSRLDKLETNDTYNYLMYQDARDDETRILEAARRLLTRHGPDFTMGQLAEEAGVSRATLYRRVPGREALAERLRAEGIEPGAELGDPRRERILHATRSLVDDHGLWFTIEQVAEAAGVGAATVYRTFGDRDGLLHAFLDEHGPRRVATARLGDLEAPIEAALHPVVTSLMRFFLEFPGLARSVLLDRGIDAEEIQRLRRGSRSTASRVTEYMEAQVERGVLRGDPLLLATSLLGMVLGNSLLAPVFASRAERKDPRPESGSAEAVEAHAQQVLALWLRGAGA